MLIDLYSRFKKAIAPCWTNIEIEIIFFKFCKYAS